MDTLVQACIYLSSGADACSRCRDDWMQVLRILNKRGRQFQKVALKHHYMQYEKFMLKRGAFSEVRLQARCTITCLQCSHSTLSYTCVKR
jgi:hypothetical protein